MDSIKPFINKIEYKHINKDFRSIENNYNTEFLRDWNLDSTLLDINNQFNKTQNQSSAELKFCKINSFKLFTFPSTAKTF